MTSGFTVWFTGMMGVGKSTLAKSLESRLRRIGRKVEVLDGDEIDELLAIGTGETKDAINTEVRRLGLLARMLTRNDAIALVSASQSPYRDARDEVRKQVGRFYEVFVDAPVEVLAKRDRSGNYRKALAGELKNFIGISSPYETPAAAEAVVRTDQEDAEAAADRLLEGLAAHGLLRPDELGLKRAPKKVQRADAKVAPAPEKAAPAAKSPAAKPAKGAKPAKVAKAQKVAAKATKAVKKATRNVKEASRKLGRSAAARTARSSR